MSHPHYTHLNLLMNEESSPKCFETHLNLLRLTLRGFFFPRYSELILHRPIGALCKWEGVKDELALIHHHSRLCSLTDFYFQSRFTESEGQRPQGKKRQP